MFIYVNKIASKWYPNQGLRNDRKNIHYAGSSTYKRNKTVTSAQKKIPEIRFDAMIPARCTFAARVGHHEAFHTIGQRLIKIALKQKVGEEEVNQCFPGDQRRRQAGGAARHCRNQLNTIFFLCYYSSTCTSSCHLVQRFPVDSNRSWHIQGIRLTRLGLIFP